MAEYVGRRWTATKLSVSLAVAAVLGGLVARAEQAPEPPAPKPLTFELLKKTTAIGTREVVNHSLLYKDFKQGEIYSKEMTDDLFLKIKVANNRFMKFADAFKIFPKVEDVYQKVRADELFAKVEDVYKKLDIDNLFAKIAEVYSKDQADSRFVEGDGSVLSGHEVATDTPVEVLDLPMLANLRGHPGDTMVGPHIRITNTCGQAMQVVGPGDTQEVVPAMGFFDVFFGGDLTQTYQLICPADPSAPEGMIATLTLGGVPVTGQAQALSFSAQALVGSLD